MLKVFDLSSWEDSVNDLRRIDFRAAKAGGVVAGIFRLANGTGIDRTAKQFIEDCEGVMPWGTYGILYSTLTAKAQANAYVKFVKECGHGDLPLIVDWELEGVTWQMVAEYIAILQRDIPGVEILIYSRAEFLKRMLPSKAWSLFKYLWFTQFHIWQAQYSVSPDPLPIGFTRALWQYTDKYDASLVGITEAKGVDMSYFDGDIEQFNERFGVDVDVTPPEIPPVTGRMATVSVDAINVREMVWGVIVPPSVKRGERVKVLLTVQDTSNNTWAKIGDERWICSVYQGAKWIAYDDEISAGSRYGFSSLNYFPRLGGGPLTLPMTRTRGKLGDNGLNLVWNDWKQLIKDMNPNNPSAIDLICRPDWGPSKGMSGDFIKWIGLLWPGDNEFELEKDKLGNEIIVDGWGMVQGMTSPSSPVIKMEVFDYNKKNGWSHRKNPVFVPIVGGPWWVDMRYVVKK
jgi:hypothetical protein